MFGTDADAVGAVAAGDCRVDRLVVATGKLGQHRALVATAIAQGALNMLVTEDETRMANARIEVAQAQYFDFVVINALFESALFDLKAIVHSQRLKYAAQLRNKAAVFRALDLC